MVARILVIDDNPDLASNVADILQGARELDVEVRAYPRDRAGVRTRGHTEGFDVAIVDVKLPTPAASTSFDRFARFADGEIILITGFRQPSILRFRRFARARSRSC